MSEASDEVRAAAQRWVVDADLLPLGAGHIHDTYEVRCPTGRYVLQRVNQSVFARPEQLMAQMQRVLKCWGEQSRYQVPVLCESIDGRLLEHCAGQYWRMWRYLADTQVVDPVRSAAQATAAGAAFGQFQFHLTSQGPGAAQLQETIPGFLQLPHYLQRFDAVSGQAPAAERALVGRSRHFAQALSTRNSCIHGDCKINNLLFDRAGEQVAAIIDFDTVMYGHWAWDFGDLVRSICFSRQHVDLDMFEAVLRGFAGTQPLTDVQGCVAGPAYVALMLGIRFLTDHLQGDVYFRVDAPGQNLQRAREQFELFEQFCACADDMTLLAQDVLSSGA